MRKTFWIAAAIVQCVLAVQVVQLVSEHMNIGVVLATACAFVLSAMGFIEEAFPRLKKI